MSYERLAYFLLVGQSAERIVNIAPDLAPKDEMPLSSALDLALAMPAVVKKAGNAAEIFKYLFVFENFLRDLVLETLAEENPTDWWDKKVPDDVKTDVAKSRDTEETKAWMAMGTRDNISLTTYPQLIRIIDVCWKDDFEEMIKDKSLLQQARLITHMRNAICHMTEIPEEEINRIKQVLRDWFRAVAP